MGSRGQGAVPDTWNEVPHLPFATCEHRENNLTLTSLLLASVPGRDLHTVGVLGPIDT